MSRFGSDGSLVLTPVQMDAVDAAMVAAGRSERALMQSAGEAVASAIRARWPRRKVLVLCGPGNNGGDGFVAARMLSEAGWPVRLMLLGSPERLKADAAHHARRWGGEILPFQVEWFEDAIVVDALFGSGLSRPIAGAARAMIEALIKQRPPVCAIDVPSGVDGATGAVLGVAAAAELTVTFCRKKPGHLLLPGRSLSGVVHVAPIGDPTLALRQIAPQTYENGPSLWADAYPWPLTEGNKYRRGHAVVVGGATMTGASRLAARGAARIGAGLVTMAVPLSAWTIYAAALTSVMVSTIREPHEFDALLQDPRCNAVAVGPGAGISEETRHCVLAALAARRAVVIDADAITAFADDPGTLFQAINGPCVITPHEGEFRRLFDPTGDRLAMVRRAAQQSGAVVLLKGADTVIAEPGGRAVINCNAPPSLATAGSGDVLAGFVVGLLAQGLDPFRAACAAVWLHGEAAALFGDGLIAEDLPEQLPAALRALRQRRLPHGDDAGHASGRHGDD